MSQSLMVNGNINFSIRDACSKFFSEYLNPFKNEKFSVLEINIKQIIKLQKISQLSGASHNKGQESGQLINGVIKLKGIERS